MVVKNGKCAVASKIAFLFVFTNAAESLKESTIENNRNEILGTQRVLDNIYSSP